MFIIAETVKLWLSLLWVIYIDKTYIMSPVSLQRDEHPVAGLHLLLGCSSVLLRYTPQHAQAHTHKQHMCALKWCMHRRGIYSGEGDRDSCVSARFITNCHHTHLPWPEAHIGTAGKVPLFFSSLRPIPQMRALLTPMEPVGRWFTSVRIMSPVLTSSLG